VAFVRGQIHFMDALHDSTERGAVENLECGAAEQELAGAGEAREFVQAFDGVADGVEQVVAGERGEVAPGVPGPLAREDTVVLFAAERGQQKEFGL
jgi:hypothetical protein